MSIRCGTEAAVGAAGRTDDHPVQRHGDADASGPRAQLLAEMPVTEHRLRLAGVPTAVLEAGDGPPVVLLHGPGEFAATWMRAIPPIAETHRVIAPDLPGHGASEMPDGELDENRVVAWLGELIDRTCPSPPVIAGHLLGGAIAARFAADHGHRVDRLVLVDSFGLAPYRPALSFALPMIGFVMRPTERTQDWFFRRGFADMDALREDVGDPWEPLLAYALECARGPSLKAALRSLMPKFALPAIPPADLARIDVPTTLIWGRHDLQVRLRVAERASERYGWPLHVIEGAADDPAVEQPEAFMRAMRAALRHA